MGWPSGRAAQACTRVAQMRQCVTLHVLCAPDLCRADTLAQNKRKKACNTSKPVLMRDSAASSMELIADSHAALPHVAAERVKVPPSSWPGQALRRDEHKSDSVRTAVHT
jgi:hypothetical protein